LVWLSKKASVTPLPNPKQPDNRKAQVEIRTAFFNMMAFFSKEKT
jgi:hypothetical protein